MGKGNVEKNFFEEVIASLEEVILEVIASLEVKEVIALRARSYSRYRSWC